MADLNVGLLYGATQRFKQRVQDTGKESLAAAPPTSERTNYLAHTLSKERAQLLSIDAAAKGATQPPEETIRRIANERVIGSSELVDFNFLELAMAVGRGVARLRVGNAFGTGVLVGPGIIMTNHHVIGSEADAATAVAQFDYQANARGEMQPFHEFRMTPARFFLTDATLDFTMIALQPASDKARSVLEYPWVPLIGQTGKAEKGDPVNIIQHPNGGLKKISFRENKVIDIPKEVKDFLYYTTDTEPGSSGSPCYNDQWELIALHHSGVADTDANGAILKHDKTVWRDGTDPEALIEWIANEGGRISAIVAILQAAKLQNEAADLRGKMLSADAAPNPVELARKNADVSNTPPQVVLPEPNPQGVTTMSQSVILTVPLNITFSIGDLGPAVAAAAASVIATPQVAPAQPETAPAGAEAVTIDPDWSKRKGYDSKFLGIDVPLPKLSTSQLADTVLVPPQFQAPGDKNLLNYYHYSVKMSKKRRSAWFSAAMIDGTRFIDFKRGPDKWFLDTRIDTKFQMGEELYTGANTDRGHLTRFKDLSWGANMAEAVNGTNDSFHFTNCTLQLDNFNEGKDRWQGLELYLLENHAKADHRKMVVITGPVYKTTDPKYKNPSMSYTAQIPLAFWKICVLKRTDGTMAATAFTLGQEDITALKGFEEKLDIATAQITVHDLEKLIGMDLGTLKDHDIFAQTHDPGALEAFRPEGETAKVKPIEDYGQIVI